MTREAPRAATALPLVARIIRAILTHPVAISIKGRLRDLRWAAAGREIVNPPVPCAVRSILFVCLGNICRSPFAAARARQLLDRAGADGIRCASAGIETSQGNRSPVEACEAAAAFGLRLESHLPVQLTRALASEYDVMVVMEAAQKTIVQEQFPELASRVLLLPLFDGADLAGYARYNIADPFGQPRAAFDSCYRRIDHALASLISHVTRSSSHAAAEKPRVELTTV